MYEDLVSRSETSESPLNTSWWQPGQCKQQVKYIALPSQKGKKACREKARLRTNTKQHWLPMDSTPTAQPTGPAGGDTSFSEDPHISFDRGTGKWRYETDDGKEFEYDDVARAWVPIVCDDLDYLSYVPEADHFPRVPLPYALCFDDVVRRGHDQSTASRLLGCRS